MTPSSASLEGLRQGPGMGTFRLVRTPDRAAPRRKCPARSDHAGRSRRWFAALLWRAFPGPSERAVAEVAARALGVSERQVRNWLRCEHDAGLRHVTAVVLIAGAEVAFGLFADAP